MRQINYQQQSYYYYLNWRIWTCILIKKRRNKSHNSAPWTPTVGTQSIHDSARMDNNREFLVNISGQIFIFKIQNQDHQKPFDNIKSFCNKHWLTLNELKHSGHCPNIILVLLVQRIHIRIRKLCDRCMRHSSNKERINIFHNRIPFDDNSWMKSYFIPGN